MGLYQNDTPTGKAKMRSAILCNFFAIYIETVYEV